MRSRIMNKRSARADRLLWKIQFRGSPVAYVWDSGNRSNEAAIALAASSFSISLPRGMRRWVVTTDWESPASPRVARISQLYPHTSEHRRILRMSTRVNPWVSDEEYRRCFGREEKRGGRLPPLRSVNVPRNKNPNDIDLDRAGIVNSFDAIPGRGSDSLFWFQFGAYASTNVFVWRGPGMSSVENALEEAASWLAENNPEILISEAEMSDLYEETARDEGLPSPYDDWESEEAERVRQIAEIDKIYTESGWLNSWEWTVRDLGPREELYKRVWERTVDQLAEEGDLDDDDVEEVNEFARKHDIDTRWDTEEYTSNPHMLPEYVKGSFAVGEVDGEHVSVPWEYRRDQEWDSFPSKESGYWAQLSAPGYLDQTGWDGPFETLKEAKEYIKSTWEVDPETGEELYE